MAPTIRWNYYAVRRGTQSDSRGVYETWEEATVHCTGEKGKKKVSIKYKGFTRRADADAYIEFANDTDADAYAKAGAANNHKGTLDDGQKTPLSSVDSRASSHAASPIAPPLTRAAAAKQGKLPPFKSWDQSYLKRSTRKDTERPPRQLKPQPSEDNTVEEQEAETPEAAVKRLEAELQAAKEWKKRRVLNTLNAEERVQAISESRPANNDQHEIRQPTQETLYMPSQVRQESSSNTEGTAFNTEHEIELQRNRVIDHTNNVTTARDRNDAYGAIAAYKQVAAGQQNLILLELIRNLEIDNGDVNQSIVYERAQLQLRQSLRPTFDQIFQIYRELLHNKQEAYDKSETDYDDMFDKLVQAQEERTLAEENLDIVGKELLRLRKLEKDLKKHPHLLRELQTRSHLRIADKGSCQQCGDFPFLPDTLETHLCMHCAATGQRRPASLLEEDSSSISTPEEYTGKEEAPQLPIATDHELNVERLQSQLERVRASQAAEKELAKKAAHRTLEREIERKNLATLEITKRQNLTNSVVKKRAEKKRAAEDKEIASLQEELRTVAKKGKARKIKRSRTPAAPRHQTVPFDWAEANDGQLVQLAFIPADDNETLEQAQKRREEINKRFKEFKTRRAAAKAELQEASIDLTDDGNSDTEEEAPRKKKRKSRKN